MKHQIDPAKKTLSIQIPGDIMSTNVEALRKEIIALIPAPTAEKKWATLELDLINTKMIDSAGLNLIVSLVKMLSGQNCKLRALLASQNIRRAFLFTRLDRHLEIVMVEPAKN